MKINYFDSIRVSPPVDKIYNRLSFSKTRTKITDVQKGKVDEYMQEADNLLDIKGAAIRISVSELTNEQIVLSSGDIFKSQSLSKFLTGCDEVLLMGATGGSEIMEAIQNKSSSDDMMCAVVFDAVASETVDEALSWIMNFYNQNLRREGRHLTRLRYSPGYGDFALENQEIMYNALAMSEIGVSLTETHILVPEKSVTAIAGIKNVESGK